jgi:hypothetical protein
MASGLGPEGCGFDSLPAYQNIVWGGSSTGRAVALQASGCRFDPGPFHQVVRVAQMVERKVVAPAVADSNSVPHPK